MSDDVQQQRDYEEAQYALAEGDVDTARDCLKRMLRRAPNDPGTLELSGDFARMRGEFVKAEKLYQKMTEVSNDPSVRGVSLLNRGLLYDQQGDPRKAKPMFLQAAEVFQQLTQSDRRMYALTSLGNVYMLMGELRDAESAFQQALEVLYETDEQSEGAEEDDETMAHVERQLGTVLRMLGELDRAEKLFQSAIARFERVDDPIEMASTVDSLALIRRIQENYDEAKSLHLQAAEINQALEYEEGLALNFLNLASLHTQLQEYDHAEEYLKKAYAIYRATGNDEGVADYHLQLGEMYDELGKLRKQQGRLEEAREAWQHALAAYEQLQSDPMIREVRERLTELASSSSIGLDGERERDVGA